MTIISSMSENPDFLDNVNPPGQFRSKFYARNFFLGAGVRQTFRMAAMLLLSV